MDETTPVAAEVDTASRELLDEGVLGHRVCRHELSDSSAEHIGGDRHEPDHARCGSVSLPHGAQASPTWQAGSAHARASAASISESLTGRVRILDLWPLSQGELAGRRERLVDRLYRPTRELRTVERAALSRAQLFERVVLGGFPAAHRLPSARLRAAWFGDYVRTLLQRDLAELRRPGRLVDLPRLVQLVLARTGQELVMSSMANDLRLSVDTVKEYLGLLETVYLFHTVGGWSASGGRGIKRPKIHAVDTGLAAALLNTSVDDLRRPESALAGPLLETFVAGELARQLSWSETPVRLFHWRDRDGREVDLIAESSDGRVAAIEVKAARDVDEHDFRPLVTLRDRLGDRFVNGVVIHLGERPLAFGDRLTALPVSALWA